MDAPSSSMDAGPAKRLLPSRTRRAATGMLGSEVDLMILDAHKWRDTEQLLSETQHFILSTNSTYAESSVDRDRVVNTVVNERYFNKPEVIRSYREQIVIQTPEFCNLKDAPVVGSRFRVREVDQTVVDTSDAAYERRHRKYEAFEKRVRLREKEKLQYEHYKLKERIDQLRSMDSSAFLSLPVSYFSPIPGLAPGEDFSSLPGAQVNGAAALNEGERRRQEMLESASILEERYRTLLPPERVTKKATKPPEPVAPPEPEVPTEPVSLKLKLPKAGSTSSTRSPSYAPPNAPVAKKPRLATPKEPSAPRARKQQQQQPQLVPIATSPPPPPPPVIHPAHADMAIDVTANEPTSIPTDDPMNVEQISNIRTVIPSSPPRVSPPPLSEAIADSPPRNTIHFHRATAPVPPQPSSPRSPFHTALQVHPEQDLLQVSPPIQASVQVSPQIQASPQVSSIPASPQVSPIQFSPQVSPIQAFPQVSSIQATPQVSPIQVSPQLQVSPHLPPIRASPQVPPPTQAPPRVSSLSHAPPQEIVPSQAPLQTSSLSQGAPQVSPSSHVLLQASPLSQAVLQFIPPSQASTPDAPVPGPVVEEYESVSIARPGKRPKQSKGKGRKSISRAPSLPSIETISAQVAPVSTMPPPDTGSPAPSGSNVSKVRQRAKPKPRETCILLQTARRNVGTREKQPRNVMAFGVKLPWIFTELVEYESPAWLTERPMMTGREPDGSDESETEDEVDQLEPDHSLPPEIRILGDHKGQQFQQLPDKTQKPIENGVTSPNNEMSTHLRSPPFQALSSQERPEIESEDEDDNKMEA